MLLCGIETRSLAATERRNWELLRPGVTDRSTEEAGETELQVVRYLRE